MNKMIKTTSCFLAVLGLLCIGTTMFSGTVTDATAYLSHRDEVNNQVTVGDNTSHITEDFTSPDDITPNTDYKKTVRVKNDTDTDSYVRVFVENSNQSVPVSINFDKKYWTEKQDDGYYYYKSVLGAKKETEPLFTTVTTGDTTEYFKILVYEETVQAEGYDTPQEAFSSIQAK